MKHFEIQYCIGRNCFTLKTTSIADVFEATCDAVAAASGDINSKKTRDEIFLELFELHAGELNFVKPAENIWIFLRDGEV